MIFNTTQNICISKQEINANTMFKQTCGLMFRRKANCLMTFKTPQPISLHNFFVLYPLDIILLDEHKIIIEIKKQFKPFSVWSSKTKALYCLELAYPSTYKMGDQLELSSK